MTTQGAIPNPLGLTDYQQALMMELIGRWFTEKFSCRFQPDNLPRPSDVLLGERFTLMVETKDGPVPYSRKSG